MIDKKYIKPGDRIIQNDPEEPTERPYRGTVTDIQYCGPGPYDCLVIIQVDEESMQDPYVAACCPNGIMVCFPWTIELLSE